MVAPVVTTLVAGTFHRWMRKVGWVGDQDKVARVTKDPTIANGLLAANGLASVEDGGWRGAPRDS
jgi:hypothetical protein